MLILAGDSAGDFGNYMFGTLPREISLLTGLKRFIAPMNDLQGDIGGPFNGLRELDTVVLSNNKLKGTIPVDVLVQNPNLGKFCFKISKKLFSAGHPCHLKERCFVFKGF